MYLGPLRNCPPTGEDPFRLPSLVVPWDPRKSSDSGLDSIKRRTYGGTGGCVGYSVIQ